MLIVANPKPIGKAGVVHPRKRSRTIKVYTDLRLVSYRRLRTIAARRRCSLAQLLREIVEPSLEKM